MTQPDPPPTARLAALEAKWRRGHGPVTPILEEVLAIARQALDREAVTTVAVRAVARSLKVAADSAANASPSSSDLAGWSLRLYKSTGGL